MPGVFQKQEDGWNGWSGVSKGNFHSDGRMGN